MSEWIRGLKQGPISTRFERIRTPKKPVRWKIFYILTPYLEIIFTVSACQPGQILFAKYSGQLFLLFIFALTVVMPEITRITEKNRYIVTGSPRRRMPKETPVNGMRKINDCREVAPNL